MSENNTAIQYVSKRNDKATIIGKIITLVVVVAVLLAFSRIEAIRYYLLILVIGTVLIASAIMRNFSVEYQYLISDGTFSVDCVYGVSKRKNVLFVELSAITESAPMNTPDSKEIISRAGKVLDLSSSRNAEGRICFFVEEDSLAFILEPDSNILSLLRGGQSL